MNGRATRRWRRSWRWEGVEIAAVVTALEALQTDLLRIQLADHFSFSAADPADPADPAATAAAAAARILFCGNFGIILVNLAWATRGSRDALSILEKMIEVTMMRGAQSGGVVTYNDGGDASAMSSDSGVGAGAAGRGRGGGGKGLRSVRARVVNGKRTDLSKLVRQKLERAVSGVRHSPRFHPFFAGHTRFATSSKCTMDGTHPHRWSPARSLPVYDRYGVAAVPVARRVNVENYICHNGDFEFFQIGGEWYDTAAVQLWLEKATGARMPSVVDSAAIAGVVDLLRAQGSWDLSVRYAFLFGVSQSAAEDAVKLEHRKIPPWEDFVGVATAFDDAFLAEAKKMQQGADSSVSHRGGWRRGPSIDRGTGYLGGEGRGGSSSGAAADAGHEGSTARGNVFSRIGSVGNVWGSLMSMMDASTHGGDKGGDSASSPRAGRGGATWHSDQDESTRHSNRYNFRGDDSTHRGSRFMIAPSNTVMERLANRRRAISAAALKTLRARANSDRNGNANGSVLGLQDGRVGGDVEEGVSPSLSSQLEAFCTAAVDAFFDNDLIRTSRMFLKSSRGSFGLCISSSLDADRQMALAARGQTMSVAFYPKVGLVLYGSEQAAVKAALGKKAPTAVPGGVSGEWPSSSTTSAFQPHFPAGAGVPPSSGLSGRPGDAAAPSSSGPKEEEPAFRLDLDDLGGEICVLDWAGAAGLPPLQLSRNERNLRHYSVMRDAVTVTLISETVALSKQSFFQRLVPIEDNPLVTALPASCADPVAKDVGDIPSALKWIQEDWNGGNSLNRATGWNLARKLKLRLRKRADGQLPPAAVDVVVTGCEVSLWVGEQFASDLSALMPLLRVRTMSSNKVLGLLGQDFPVPAVGHDMTEDSWDLNNAIVIIVSHSGGTFGPLATANLMQASTADIFLVASEWDTQVGKQLRKLGDQPRVFSTGVGLRPAEPCSVSVAATHQLLTQILQHLALAVMSDPRLRRAVGCQYTDQDLSELERCNRDNVDAIRDIVGSVGGDSGGGSGGGGRSDTDTSRHLKAKGDTWAQHVLEAPRAWAMSAAYIAVTVTLGYPLVSGVAAACGVTVVWALRLFGFLDAAIYVFIPQITTWMIRAWQGRMAFHRMTGEDAHTNGSGEGRFLFLFFFKGGGKERGGGGEARH